MTRRLAIVASMAALLAACGPVSQGQAEATCSERARKAAGPTGEAGIGYNTQRGAISRVEIEISADYIAGRDPAAVYDQCIRQLTGRAPAVPYGG